MTTGTSLSSKGGTDGFLGDSSVGGGGARGG